MNRNIFKDKWRFGELPAVFPSQESLNCEKMVAMGSCFARNIIRWLFHYGCSKQTMPWGILYNPFSVLMEIKRLFEPIDYENYVVVENSVHGKIYRDPWRNWCYGFSMQELKQKNNAFDVKAKGIILQTTSLLLTFGLSEIWSFRDDTGIILNQVPLYLTEDNWVPRMADIEETTLAIIEIVNIVRKYLGESLPLILSLSPIPLKYTTRESIREANTVSKAILRVALYKVYEQRKDVIYFPSYEIIQALVEKREIDVWQDDGRHITAGAIDVVVRQFLLACGSNITANEGNFFVPLVDKYGKTVGKLYVDGKKILC